MKSRPRFNVSFFVIILLPLMSVTVVALGFFFLFRNRFEILYGMPFEHLNPDFLEFAIAVIVLLLVVLFFTGLALAFWVYKSVTEPLHNLGTATRKIRDGDYDFEIVEEGPDEIRELCHGFEEMRTRLKEAGEEKIAYDAENKELISNISHDLKTPIAAVKGYVEGIMDGVADTPEKMDHYLRTIYNKTNEMDTLINELTFYSKIDTNRVPYTFAKVHARGFFDDAAEDIRMELTEAGVSFTYENHIDPSVIIIADVEQIRRVVSNIVANSLKYMDKEEKIMSMRVEDAISFVRVAIRDNGRGIPKQDVANIFKRFYRADTSRHEKGSGIGLSIVRKIMEDHGGHVYAQSIEGEETTIFLEFRKYVEVVAEETEETSEGRGRTGKAKKEAKEKKPREKKPREKKPKRTRAEDKKGDAA